jgi:ABC-type multidrug transport system ATPase subunit
VTSPLLHLSRARIDVDGVPEVDGLSLETTGDRVLVLGAAPALFEAAAGLRALRHGELRVRGEDALLAVRGATSASAPLDPPLPPRWTVREYVSWSARLAGRAKQDANESAGDAIGRMKLEALRDTFLKNALEARRAIVVAAALATGAATILLEDPLRGMPNDAARGFARILARATVDVSTVVFAARVSLASPLAIDADEALVVHGSQVVGQGAPAEVAARDRTYAIRLHGRGAAFARLAEERGARVAGAGSLWTVDLGEGLRTSDLLDMALRSNTVVLELRPLAHAFT